MANNLSQALLAQLYGQQSDDPFLTLVTLSHPEFADDIRLVNNTVDITSNGQIYSAFPMNIVPPRDDGETTREVTIVFDNVSLELLDELRTATVSIQVKLDMILASNPDEIQMSLGELKIKTVSYNASTITAQLYLDDFFNTELTSEKYNPTDWKGLF